jgi:predicted kinase
VEGIVFIGLQGSGKSSFFKERLFRTHVRISLDLLRTRHREDRLLRFCLETEQPFAIDNTNPASTDRQAYLRDARARGVETIGYYFQSKVEDCQRRNRQRTAEERVPDVAILSAAKKLELPSLEEGFDRLYYVRLTPAGFVVEEWQDDV